MGFDPVSYAMGKAAGGGGGGGGGDENAFASLAAPTSADGQDGQYWFQLAGGFTPGYSGSLSGMANTPTAGWQFTATEALKVVGLRGRTRAAVAGGYLKFGTLTDILAEVQTDFLSGEWTNVLLDNPITLTPGTDYIVMLFGSSQTLSYSASSALTFQAGITYKQARYGSYPGTIEQNNVYSADILIEATPPYQMSKQYYKSNGTWSEVI